MSKKYVVLAMISGSVWLLPGAISAAGVEAVKAGADWMGMAYIGAGLAVGLACLASGIAVARIGSAAIGAVSEKSELMGRTLVFLGLAEGIAIYGLIIAIMILNKL
ncbi:MAG: ATP synthase subunit C [Smithella sp.]|jgi:V/A-type H+-transporting ATPase subunit K